MARGGQLFAPAPQPISWLRIGLYVVGAAVAVYILYLAFFKSCPPRSVKEQFSGCPCNDKKRQRGFFLL